MAPGCSCINFFYDEPETLGILGFDAAKTMCRLLSLYKSLTDAEINNLRGHVIISKGVTHLNSRDQCFLLNLACAERLEDLNLAAAAVSRLGLRSSDVSLRHFDAVFSAVKRGAADIKKLEFGTRNVARVIEKTEKLVSATRKLHNSMESLVEAEASERKLQHWRHMRSTQGGLKVKVESFNDRIASHKRQVEHYKQISLWGMTFDKVVGLMARIVFIVFARICSVFGSLVTAVSGCNSNSAADENRELYRMNLCLFDQEEEILTKRNNIGSYVLKCNRTGVVRLPNRPPPPDGGVGKVKNHGVWRLAPASTVGGAGLSWRYANVILFVERCMRCKVAIGKDARVAMYGLLPGRLKGRVKAKLREEWLKRDESLEGGEEGLPALNDTVGEVMEWLLPVALDTVRWQAERNMEKQKFETKPTVLLLQTLHYSDLDKVEEAIVEVLVGLSCIYWSRKQC